MSISDSPKKTVVPYSNSNNSKKEQVEKMFDNISSNYDFLNHFLSLGIDIQWRKKALRILKDRKINHLFDVATGTGDFGIMAHKMLDIPKITGIDISEGMLEVGRKKIHARGLVDVMKMVKADSEEIPFENETADAVIVAFGVRNFQDPAKGLKEINRVLTKGGDIIVLEFSKPRSFPFKQLYNFYFKYILPTIGQLISKDKSAYTYLPESVQAFPDGQDFLNLLKECGFEKTNVQSLTLGIASIYHGIKA